MDIKDWDYWIDNIDSIDLSPLDKSKAKNALSYVQKTFDASIQSLFENKHPIVSNIFNTAPWTRKWFINFAESLKKASSHKNYKKNLSKLKTPSLYSEALLELDVAIAMMNVGFDVEFYKRLQSIDKEPDLKITNPKTDEEFFVEVTHLDASDQAKDANSTFDVIFNTIFRNSFRDGNHLSYSGTIHKYLSKPNLKRVLEKLTASIDEAYDSGFSELYEKGTLELAFSTEDKEKFLRQWEHEKGIEIGTFSGPSYDTDEAHRLGQKIRKKQTQLPKELLNILVIKDDTMYMLGNRDVDDIGRLEEYVYEHDHLAFCIFFNSFTGGSNKEKIRMIGDHFRLEAPSDLKVRQLLFLVNKFISNKKMTPDSASKIREGFLQHRVFLV